MELIRDRSSGTHLTWIGHASFLGCLGGHHFLIDPVFAQRIAVVYRRFGNPGLRVDQLPELKAVMISHNHYDHLDMPSLRAIPKRVPVVCPMGLASRLRRRSRHPCLELSWWESTTLNGLKITLVPARHWSRRRILDTNRTLWGGFVVEADDKRLYHAGDTGWFRGFAEIGQRFPDLLAAMLPIGGYEPGWFMEHQHLTPEQAGRAFELLGAESLVPMHWGALQLTDEPLSEPIERLRAWWRQQGPDDARRGLLVPRVGETLMLERER